MAFGNKTPREYIEDKHGELDRAVNNALDGDVTVVSVVSISDVEGGQMIMADTGYDKRKLAKRLRLCADILDPSPAHSVSMLAATVVINDAGDTLDMHESGRAA